MAQTVLLVDIDNTLYDWPSFFAPSFRAMIHVLSRELALPEERLYDEAKTVFAQRGSLEYAFVIQELESVKSSDLETRRRLIEAGRGAFRSVQKKRLIPYPGVIDTLQWLRRHDVIVIGVTNSPVYRAQHRLYDLHLDSLLGGLVAWEGFEPSPDDEASQGFVRRGRTRVLSRLPEDRVWKISEEECKPNEMHYVRALDAFASSASEAWAIGDSLYKDLVPAARLGIKTIWAKYGADFDPSNTDAATLLRITHWTPSRIATTYTKNGFTPNETVDSFEQLRQIIPEKYMTLF